MQSTLIRVSTMFHSKLLGLCALLIFSSSGIAYSQPRIDFSLLNLSPEQKQAIRQIRQTDGDQVRRLRQDVKTSRRQLRMLVDDDAPEPQIKQELDRLVQLQGQLTRMQVGNLIKVRKVLTPEQRVQIRQQLESEDRPPE
jgi:Spy/CpxP family protein refolding chaperone